MIDWDTDLLAHTHATFGERVTYYPASGAIRTLTAVFNEAYTSVALEEGLEVASTRPILNIRATILPRTPEQGDLWNVRGILYQTTIAKADGMGDIRVELRLGTDDQLARLPLPPVAPAS